MKHLLSLLLLCFLALGASAQSANECFDKGKTCDDAKNYTEAAEWYRKAAEQGNAEAQYSLGDCYMAGIGVTKDATEAVKWFHKAAEQGNKIAIEALESKF